jgi:cytochrome c oxidase subunit 2
MSRWLLAVLVPATLIGGCGGIQSTLAPQGPGAAPVVLLTWTLFGLGAAIFLAVAFAATMAIYGPAATRAMLARDGAVVVCGILVPVVILTALLAYGVWLMHAGQAAATEGNVRRIEVVGEQWWWRVAYVDRGGAKIASANELRIPAGQPVELVLRSADVIHSFWVPNLGGKVDMIPGRTTYLRLSADRPGTFRGQCAEYCGGPHALMAMEVTAVPAGDYETWLTAQAAPAATPEADNTRRGLTLFLSAGCGACHAIRGTAAAGTIGPDLTHLASRRSLAANLLPLSHASLARFIADNQRIKPGNRMPTFRIFPEADLDALAAFLASLR